MPTDFIEAVRRQLAELGYPVDHLPDEEVRKLVTRLIRAMAQRKDIDEVLRQIDPKKDD